MFGEDFIDGFILIDFFIIDIEFEFKVFFKVDFFAGKSINPSSSFILNKLGFMLCLGCGVTLL